MQLDKMTDEEIVVATLKMLGYARNPSYFKSMWFRGDDEWEIGDILIMHYEHRFAAEVIDFMLKKNYRWEVSSKLGWGYVQFVETFRRMDNCALFNNMAEFPRAVCIAALKALDNV